MRTIPSNDTPAGSDVPGGCQRQPAGPAELGQDPPRGGEEQRVGPQDLRDASQQTEESAAIQPTASTTDTRRPLRDGEERRKERIAKSGWHVHDLVQLTPLKCNDLTSCFRRGSTAGVC